MQKSLQLNWAIQIWISTLSQPTSLALRTSLLQTLMLTKHLSMICKPMTSLLVTSTLVNWMQVNWNSQQELVKRSRLLTALQVT